MKTSLQKYITLPAVFLTLLNSACGSAGGTPNLNPNTQIASQQMVGSATAKALSGLKAAQTRVLQRQPSPLVKASVAHLEDFESDEQDEFPNEDSESNGENEDSDSDEFSYSDIDEDSEVEDIDFNCQEEGNTVSCRGVCNEDGTGAVTVTLELDGNSNPASSRIDFAGCNVSTCSGEVKLTGTGTLEFQNACDATLNLTLVQSSQNNQSVTMEYKNVQIDGGEGSSCKAELSCSDVSGNVTVNGSQLSASQACEEASKQTTCSVEPEEDSSKSDGEKTDSDSEESEPSDNSDDDSEGDSDEEHAFPPFDSEEDLDQSEEN